MKYQQSNRDHSEIMEKQMTRVNIKLYHHFCHIVENKLYRDLETQLYNKLGYDNEIHREE